MKVQQEVRELLGKQQSESVKWEDPKKFHMTVFFIGETTPEKAEKISLLLNKVREKNIGGLSFEGNNISAFPNRRFPRVIIAELRDVNGKAQLLSSEISRLLKSEGLVSDKKFHPHITLGRVKRDAKITIEEPAGKIYFPENFILREFFLMQSVLKVTGSEYAVLKSFGL